ncbi:MAG: hypothetical protein Q8K63_15310 [Acidimicrobiales bacterium]|nr:hypothetical protein [Acidimicrobiales bacterium]
MSFVVQYLVDGGDDYVEEWADGALQTRSSGTDKSATITVKVPKDADAADWNVLFMQGRLKVDGDMGAMLTVLQSRST